MLFIFIFIKDTEGKTLTNYFEFLHADQTTKKNHDQSTRNVQFTIPATWHVNQAAANDVFASNFLFLVNCSGSILFPSGLVLISFLYINIYLLMDFVKLLLPA